MLEIPTPHKILTLDPKIYKWTVYFSTDYWGGLDPYSSVPEEAERCRDEISELAQEISQKITCGRTTTGGEETEGVWLGIDVNGKDFEERPCWVEVRSERSERELVDENNDPGIALSERRTYIYNNGIGVLKRVYRRDTGILWTEAVLSERFATTRDLFTLKRISEVLTRD